MNSSLGCCDDGRPNSYIPLSNNHNHTKTEFDNKILKTSNLKQENQKELLEKIITQFEIEKGLEEVPSLLKGYREDYSFRIIALEPNSKHNLAARARTFKIMAKLGYENSPKWSLSCYVTYKTRADPYQYSLLKIFKNLLEKSKLSTLGIFDYKVRFYERKKGVDYFFLEYFYQKEMFKMIVVSKTLNNGQIFQFGFNLISTHPYFKISDPNKRGTCQFLRIISGLEDCTEDLEDFEKSQESEDYLSKMKVTKGKERPNSTLPTHQNQGLASSIVKQSIREEQVNSGIKPLLEIEEYFYNEIKYPFRFNMHGDDLAGFIKTEISLLDELQGKIRPKEIFKSIVPYK